jgi:hypothetical protein
MKIFKKLFTMSLDSKEHVYILLPGPLASAKTMLLGFDEAE